MKSEALIKEKLETIEEIGSVTFYNPKKPALPYVTNKKDIVRGIRRALKWVLEDELV